MSRYLILVLLNAPLVLVAILNAMVSYKLKHISKKRLFLKLSFWISTFIVLILIEPIYNFLYSEGLTQTEALSLFDVILITASMFMFFLINKLYVKVDVNERRLNDLHQEISIRTSTDSEK